MRERRRRNETKATSVSQASKKYEVKKNEKEKMNTAANQGGDREEVEIMIHFVVPSFLLSSFPFMHTEMMS